MSTRAPLVFLVFLVAVPTTRSAPAAGRDAGTGGPAVSRRALRELPEAALPPALRERLDRSDDPQPLARLLGLRTLHGRPLEGPPAVRDWRAARRAVSAMKGPECPVTTQTDVPVAANPLLTESRPDVAASPGRAGLVVAAYLAYPYSEAPEVRCATARSVDRGRTFSPPVFLPLLGASSFCGDPVLAWAPNGSRLFAAYRDFRVGLEELVPGPGEVLRFRSFGDVDVLVSRSDDGGLSWSTPVVALDGDPWSYTVSCKGVFPCDLEDVDPGLYFERPAIATPLQGVGSRVYVAAARLAEQDPAAPPTAIVFARSDGGRVFSPAETLDAGAELPLPITVQGASVAGGRGGEVLVAWYHSGDDGPRVGTFELRVRRSANGGRTWDPLVVAAQDAYETGRDLGPLELYKQWWPTMFPAVALDLRGRAHLVYGHDPEEGDLTAEEGDIRYVTSGRAPWTDWSAPMTLNDDGLARAQGFPSLTVQGGRHAPVVDVVWEDTRNSPEVEVDTATFTSPNLYYDIYHTRWTGTVSGGGSWSPNSRVSDASSLQDRSTAGRRTDLTANDRLLFSVWTDRRWILSVTDSRQDVYGSAIKPLP